MEKLQPKLRFPEFKEIWKRTTINDICKLNPSSTNLPDTFIYIDLESVSNGVLEKENQVNLVEAPSRARRLLKAGDVLFQMVRPYQKNNFHFNLPGDYVASTGYAQMRPMGNSGFLFQYLHTKKFVDNVIEKCTGSNYPAINSSDLSELFVCFPPLPEQIKIASFLTTVDEKISGLKKQLTLLERYKKGVMQKIFSQELRFKPAPNETSGDENGNDFPDWEEKKLGEISRITTGSSNRIDSNLHGEYTFFDRSQDIRSSNRFLFDTEAIIVPGEGQEFIPKHFVGKFDLHQRTYAIMNFQPNFGKFLYYYIGYNSNHLNSQAVGSTVKSLRLPMFERMPISLPSLREQQKIASFLSSIDEKLEKCQGQIKAMENWKKGLLQQMFV